MHFEIVRGDVRLAWRGVVGRPAFASLVVLTLALGLGVGAAVFAIADAVLFRALPYREPGRLFFVWQTLPNHNVFELEATPADYTAWKNLKSFSQLGLANTDAFTLTGNGSDAERVRGARTTASLMPLLGLSPRIGRTFDSSEDDNAAAPVAILSDGLWQRRFGGEPGVVGRSVIVDGAPHTIVGVMDPAASLPGPLAASSDLWLPMRFTPAERRNAVSHNYTVIGRLADGVTERAAAGEVDRFAAAMVADQPATHTGLGAHIVSIAEDTVKNVKPALLVLLGGVAALLLIACLNVSTLMIVRAAGRRHDAAVRAALGASRTRLLSFSLVEGVLLSWIGGSVAVVVGQWALAIILPIIKESLPASAVVHVDTRVAIVTMAVAVFVGVVLGLVVGLQNGSATLADALRSGIRASTAPRVTRARSAMVVTQIAFAVMLLGAAGLMVRSIVRLSNVSPGFTADRLLTLRLSLSSDNYKPAPARTAFVDSLIERLSAAPDVERAALTSRLPLGGSRGANGVAIEGRPAARGELRIVDQRHVTPDYFRAMGIAVIRGRALAPTDAAGAEPVTVINRAMADRYWAGDDPIGTRVSLGEGFDSKTWFRIVGVVENVRHVSLSRPAVPEMYRPYAQAPVADVTVVLKTRGEPAAATSAVRSIVRSIDANLPLYDVRTMTERISGSFSQLRATMLLLAVTAALAAMLSAIAIYGSIWYSVTQRIPEFGLRLALGASRASVCGGIVGRAFRLSTVGAALGVGCTVAAGGVLRGLLFETPITDGFTYATVCAVLAVLTLAASVVPARRAMMVDPLTAIKTE